MTVEGDLSSLMQLVLSDSDELSRLIEKAHSIRVKVAEQANSVRKVLVDTSESALPLDGDTVVRTMMQEKETYIAGLESENLDLKKSLNEVHCTLDLVMEKHRVISTSSGTAAIEIASQSLSSQKLENDGLRTQVVELQQALALAMNAIKEAEEASADDELNRQEEKAQLEAQIEGLRSMLNISGDNI